MVFVRHLLRQLLAIRLAILPSPRRHKKRKQYIVEKPRPKVCQYLCRPKTSIPRLVRLKQATWHSHAERVEGHGGVGGASVQQVEGQKIISG